MRPVKLLKGRPRAVEKVRLELPGRDLDRFMDCIGPQESPIRLDEAVRIRRKLLSAAGNATVTCARCGEKRAFKGGRSVRYAICEATIGDAGTKRERRGSRT